MKHFAIENETNNIMIHGSAKDADAVPNSERFGNEAALSKLAANWPAARLVKIWNSLPGETQVKKFKDRAPAVSRIWKAIQTLGETAPAADEPAPVSEQAPVAWDQLECFRPVGARVAEIVVSVWPSVRCFMYDGSAAPCPFRPARSRHSLSSSIPYGGSVTSKLRLRVAKQASDNLRSGAITTDEPVVPEAPEIAEYRHRIRLGFRNRIRVRQTGCAVLRLKQPLKLHIVEANEIEVVILLVENRQLDPQHFIVPTRASDGQLVIRDHERAALGW